MVERLDQLQKLCGSKGLSLTLQWSEAEGLWYADAASPGMGEYYETKRAGSAQDAVDRLIERLGRVN